MSPVAPVRVAADDLRRFGSGVLRAIGTAPDDADFMAGVIVASDMAGHESHGMRRLPEYVERWRAGAADPSARPVPVADTGSLVTLDARNGFGHVVVRDATDLAVERAKAHGIAAVAVRRSEAAGRYADFCERAAAQGVAILFFVNDAGGHQTVAPPNALEPRLSTNPLAIGFPRAHSPHLVLDMSTSVVAAGRLAEAKDRGEEIPTDWVTPAGHLRPLGGVKGFGLALLVEALAGALTGAGTVGGPVGGEPDGYAQGILAIAIDVAAVRPLGDVTTDVEAFVAHVRRVPVAPGADPVRMPGESGAAATAVRSDEGVPVQPFTWDRLVALSDEFGVPLPTRQ